jgi:hypothetical protein
MTRRTALTDPAAPTPRQLLRAAQRLAAGDAPAMAAAMAGIGYHALNDLLADREPSFMELLDDARRILALSPEERDRRHHILAMDALDLLLADACPTVVAQQQRRSASGSKGRREEALIQANRNLLRLLGTITHAELDEYQSLHQYTREPANDPAAWRAA